MQAERKNRHSIPFLPFTAQYARKHGIPSEHNAMEIEDPEHDPEFFKISQLLGTFDSEGSMAAGCGGKTVKINFGDRKQVMDNWDALMSHICPAADSVKIFPPNYVFYHIKHGGSYETLDTAELVNSKPASMPPPRLQSLPHYGQLTDQQLLQINNWGKTKVLENGAFLTDYTVRGRKFLIPPPASPDQLREGALFHEMTSILASYDPGTCMAQQGRTLDFTKVTREKIVEVWEILMDAVLPIDGRLYHERGGLRRYQDAAMPRPSRTECLPFFGQLDNVQLTIMVWWAKAYNRSKKPEVALFEYADAMATLDLKQQPRGPYMPRFGDIQRKKPLIRRSVHDIWRTPWEMRDTEYGKQKPYNDLVARILDGFRFLKNPKCYPRLLKVKPGHESQYLTDLGEWGDIAAIHGGPWQYYVDPTTVKDDGDQISMWCWHHTQHFLPWHRPWLACMEAALADAGEWYNEEQSKCLGLPYWNWFEPYYQGEEKPWKTIGDPNKPIYRNGHPLFEMEYYYSMRDDNQNTLQKPIRVDNPLKKRNALTPYTLDGTLYTAERDGDGGADVKEGDYSVRPVLRGWHVTKRDDGEEMIILPSVSGETKKNNAALYFDYSISHFGPEDPEKLLDWMKVMVSEEHMRQEPMFFKKGYAADRQVWFPLPSRIETGKAGRVENIHDMVHNYLGEECQDATLAAWDPLLYLFHSNFDRLLQKIVAEEAGEDGEDMQAFFDWFTANGRSDLQGRDPTFFHVPVPFPEELRILMQDRLGLPPNERLHYKDCFDLRNFNYSYDALPHWPREAEVPNECPSKALLERPHFRVHVRFHDDMSSFASVVKDSTGEVVARYGRLGMSMNNGKMRQRMPAGPAVVPIQIPVREIPAFTQEEMAEKLAAAYRLLQSGQYRAELSGQVYMDRARRALPIQFELRGIAHAQLY